MTDEYDGGTVHIENIRTGTVHLGRREFGYRRILDGYITACGGRPDSEYHLTDAPVSCRRCLRLIAAEYEPKL